MENIMLLSAISSPTVLLFNTNIGKNRQDHSDDFKAIIAVTPNIKTPEMEVLPPLGNLIVSLNIQENIMATRKIVYKNKVEALRVLHSTMINKYRDGNINAVYYLNEQGKLRYVRCTWASFVEVWMCHEDGGIFCRDTDDRTFFPKANPQLLEV